MNNGESRTLPVAETFYSIQGEGFHTGKAAFFIRIAGCDVCCSWCDEKKVWDEHAFPDIEIDELFKMVMQSKADTVVFTGGEPFRYALSSFTSKLKKEGIVTMAETSGTEIISGSWDWITMSPKCWKHPLKENFSAIHELKVVIKENQDLLWAEEMSAVLPAHIKRYLQPEWGCFTESASLVIDYIKKHPEWRLSVQVHKFLFIP